MPPLKITVATVCFNAANVIERTIHSVEEQDYPHVEHVIVDGNSRDNTLQAIHHYQERNSIARVQHEINCLSEPDRGLYDAMNKAIGLATGDYILFLNAGDKFHSPTVLSEIAAAALATLPDEGKTIAPTDKSRIDENRIDENRIDEERLKSLPAVIYGRTDIVDNDGNFLRHRRLEPPARLTWRSFRKGMLVCHQAFFARTDLARQTPYNLRYRYSADFDWCIRLMREARRRRLALLNADLVVSDYLSEGMTTAHHRASLRERFRIMARHYGLTVTLFSHAQIALRAVTKK